MSKTSRYPMFLTASRITQFNILYRLTEVFIIRYYANFLIVILILINTSSGNPNLIQKELVFFANRHDYVFLLRAESGHWSFNILLPYQAITENSRKTSPIT